MHMYNLIVGSNIFILCHIIMIIVTIIILKIQFLHIFSIKYNCARFGKGPNTLKILTQVKYKYFEI